MLSAHERFTKATHLILFLRAEDWPSRFTQPGSQPVKLRLEQMFSGLRPRKQTCDLRVSGGLKWECQTMGDGGRAFERSTFFNHGSPALSLAVYLIPFAMFKL
jgi:hypothetical protein